MLNALSVNEELNSSQHNFMSILDHGKNLYCIGANDSSLKEYWPTSWQLSMQLLKHKSQAVEYNIGIVVIPSVHPISISSQYWEGE